MPNDPLQIFRMVEPANWGFGATASLASRPFVLQHTRVESAFTYTGGAAGSGTAANGWTGGGPTNFLNPTRTADRFYPWKNRLENHVYPVVVPNAYDRVHIFPVFMLDRTPLRRVTTSTPTGGPTTTTTADFYPTDLPIISSPISYQAPGIIPFGLYPESRGISANDGASSRSRLPDDIIAKIAPRAVPVSGARENGLWNILPPYATNFTTNNGLNAAGTVSAPTSGGRYVVTAGSASALGTAYALPHDLSVSFSTTTGLSGSSAQLSASSLTIPGYYAGVGTEFALQGCVELVVSHAFDFAGMSFIFSSTGLPNLTGTTGTNPVVNDNAPGTVYPTVGANYFLMGVFLG